MFFRKDNKTSSRAVTGPIEWVVACLGNPGREYAASRHNAGFLAADYLAAQLSFSIGRLKFRSLTGEAVISGKKVLFLKPSTFMNLSGEAVRDALHFYKIPPSNLVVICDDVSFDVGRLRVRRSGSDGGQNGLKNIIYHLASDEFPRIRVGVGQKPHPEYDLARWVLSSFSSSEMDVLNKQVFPKVRQGLEKILSGDIGAAMNLCNSASGPTPPSGDKKEKQ